MKSDGTFTLVYVIGAISCWYNGVEFWIGLFWPWYLGTVFVGVGK